MNRPVRLFILLALIAVVAVAVWYALRPVPPMPDIPLDGATPELVEAVNAAKAKVLEDPHSAEAWGGLGEVLGVNGFHVQAIICYENAAGLDSSSARWPYLQSNECIQAGRPRESIPLLTRAAENTRDRAELATIRYALCGVLIEEGYLDEAAARLRDFTAIEGDGDRSSHIRGLLARARGNREEAKRELEPLLKSPHLARRVHRILAELSDPARSRELQAAVEKLPPDTPFPNPFTASMGALRVESPNRLGEYMRLLQKDPDEALEYLRHIAVDAKDSEYPSTLGQALMQRGQWSEAADAFRHAIRLNPNNALAHMMLADSVETLARTEKQPEAAAKLLDEAMSEADAALKIQASLGQAHVVRGRVFRARKQTAESIAAFREAVTCQPEAAAMHRELGEALAESGDVRAGVASLETAAMLAPDDDAVRAALAKWKK